MSPTGAKTFVRGVLMQERKVVRWIKKFAPSLLPADFLAYRWLFY
jgi:hypothetical protein